MKIIMCLWAEFNKTENKDKILQKSLMLLRREFETDKNPEARSWRKGSLVKSRCCFYKGTESVPSTHIRQLITTCNFSSRGLTPSSCLCGHLHMYIYTHMTTYRYTRICINKNKVSLKNKPTQKSQWKRQQIQTHTNWKFL